MFGPNILRSFYRQDENHPAVKVSQPDRKYVAVVLEPWPKPFQNLRSTRETELAEIYPLHVVCAWLGNSQPVAAKHYLQVTDDHFQQAAKGLAGALHNPVQYPAARGRTDSQRGVAGEEKQVICSSMRKGATPREDGECELMGAGGFEPPKANANGFTARPLWPLGYTPVSPYLART